MSMTRVLAAVLLIAALAGAGCGNNDTTPTSPSTGSVAFSDYFTDTISTGATKFYSFSVVSGGTVQITLASLTAASSGAIVGASPTVSLGVPSGTTCAPTTSEIGRAHV